MYDGVAQPHTLDIESSSVIYCDLCMFLLDIAVGLNCWGNVSFKDKINKRIFPQLPYGLMFADSMRLVFVT